MPWSSVSQRAKHSSLVMFSDPAPVNYHLSTHRGKNARRPRTLPEGVGAVGAVAVGGDGIGVHGENVETGRVLGELVELVGPGWGGQCRCDENDGHNLG